MYVRTRREYHKVTRDPYISSRKLSSTLVGAKKTQHKGKEGLPEGLMENHARELQKPPTPELCAGPMGQLECLYLSLQKPAERNNTQQPKAK